MGEIADTRRGGRGFKRWGRWAGALAVLLLAVEAGVRIAGLTDFPVYHVDPEIGYLPQPRQSGAFLRSNDWAFNDRSMGVEAPWQPSAARVDLLLLGNSIIMGGNPYRQRDKLGPLLQSELGAGVAVWPLAAGGWSAVNATVSLERQPEVVKGSDFFVWQFMNGTFSRAAAWQGDYVFPSQRPLWATGYVCRRYLLPRLGLPVPSELPPAGAPAAANIARFEQMVSRLAAASGRSKPGLFVLYPTRDDLGAAQREGWLAEAPALQRIAAAHHIAVLDLAAQADWHAGLYRDGVHPTAAGNAVLARLLAQAVSAQLGLAAAGAATAAR